MFLSVLFVFVLFVLIFLCCLWPGVCGGLGFCLFGVFCLFICF